MKPSFATHRERIEIADRLTLDPRDAVVEAQCGEVSVRLMSWRVPELGAVCMLRRFSHLQRGDYGDIQSLTQRHFALNMTYYSMTKDAPVSAAIHFSDNTNQLRNDYEVTPGKTRYNSACDRSIDTALEWNPQSHWDEVMMAADEALRYQEIELTRRITRPRTPQEATAMGALLVAA